MKFAARYYQKEARIAFWDYIKSGKKAGLIIIPTGGGKSFVIADIISRIRKKNKDATIMCVTHSRELVAQNYNQLYNLAPELILDMGVISGTLGNDIYKPIVFSTIQTLAARLDKLKHRKDLLIIIDEAHRVPPESYTQYGQYLDFTRFQNPKHTQHLSLIHI